MAIVLNPKHICYETEADRKQFFARNTKFCKKIKKGMGFHIRVTNNLTDNMYLRWYGPGFDELYYAHVALADGSDVMPWPVFCQAAAELDLAAIEQEQLYLVSIFRFDLAMLRVFGDRYLGRKMDLDHNVVDDVEEAA